MPFRLDLTAWALRRRPGNTVDCWDGGTYRRVLAVGDKPVVVAVTQRETTLNVRVAGKKLSPAIEQVATPALKRLLGIDVDLSGFYEFAPQHARLDQLVERFRGFKPPRFASVFECVVNGIACQQLSLTVGIVFLNRLSEFRGLKFSHGMHAFPRPEDLVDLEPADLRPLGYSGNKARSIICVARAIVDGQLDLEGLTQLDDKECVERLAAIPGTPARPAAAPYPMVFRGVVDLLVRMMDSSITDLLFEQLGAFLGGQLAEDPPHNRITTFSSKLKRLGTGRNHSCVGVSTKHLMRTRTYASCITSSASLSS